MKIFFDIETTGLNPEEDDILQLAVIDQDGNELFYDTFGSVRKESWPDSEKFHHISPEMVANKKTFRQRRDEIQQIFDQAEELVAYNAPFDMGFLRRNGIVFPDVPVSDPMLDFAEVYGQWDDYRKSYKWQKLAKAAAYYGYDFDAHDALNDIRATLFVYERLKGCHM